MGPPTSSFGLTERLKQGEEGAFARVFEKYRPRLAVLIYLKLGPELRRLTEVDDVLQEVMLRAFRDIGRFGYRGPGSLLRWLAAIADHVIIDLARGRHRLRRAGEVVGLEAAPEPADSETPSRIFARAENVQRVMEQLEALPEDYRTVILLARFEGLSTPEIGERMGLARESVALLLHRALKRFRSLQEPA